MLVGRALALKLFEAFSIQRWTDVIRPIDLVEMDKAAEKMVRWAAKTPHDAEAVRVRHHR